MRISFPVGFRLPAEVFLPSHCDRPVYEAHVIPGAMHDLSFPHACHPEKIRGNFRIANHPEAKTSWAFTRLLMWAKLPTS
jgi:hypothetical protein